MKHHDGQAATGKHERLDHPELPCGTSDWDHRTYGNHRIIVECSSGGLGDAVVVDVPWRRRDTSPADVEVIVLSAASAGRVANVAVLSSDRVCGRVAFEPIDGPGTYEIYYLPYEWSGHIGYLSATYVPRSDEITDSAWHRHADETLPSGKARAVRYESVSARDTFSPMGFVASDEEVAHLVAQGNGNKFLLFPEDRLHPVEMKHFVPARWNTVSPFSTVTGVARRGEFFAFQVGVYGIEDVRDVSVHVDFPLPVRSLATEGVSPRGEAYVDRSLDISAGHVRALWFGIEVPEDLHASRFTGQVHVGEATIDLAIDVAQEIVPRNGTDQPELMTRLSWLDSRIGLDDTVPEPFTPIVRDADTLQVLGRSVTLARSGLPRGITSAFTTEVTSLHGPPRDLLANPITFAGDLDWEWQYDGPVFEHESDARTVWHQRGRGGGLNLLVRGSLEFDGCLEYELEVRSDSGDFYDAGLGLETVLHGDVAKYMMGLGEQGKVCPESFSWKWDVAARNQDALWLGDVNAGLQLSFRDENYRRPLNSNFYRESPLVEPKSWCNNGEGGISIRHTGEECTVRAHSGRIQLDVDEPLRFDFRLLVTPFKPIDSGRHLSERYYHAPNRPEEICEELADPPTPNDPGDLDTLHAYGANIVNVHHATWIAPHINNPLLTSGRLAEYIEAAHRLGIRVKTYNTVRELSTSTPETLALMSLDGEVFTRGTGAIREVFKWAAGAGHIWLQEHLNDTYVTGWYAPNVDDAAIITNGESRWHNMYVCAIDRLAEDVDLDGIYLDEIGFDRTVMKRVRNVLARHRAQPLIDLHSANQFSQKRDGQTSSLNLYMEHLPYVDRVWLGEYIDYDTIDPVYWLVEVSGIPFGVMSDMLENGGNRWRGMLFGSTARAPRMDNRAIWNFWDSVDLPSLNMVGWWAAAERRPVHVDRDDVLVTCWTGESLAVISVASWADRDVEVEITFDEVNLGFGAENVQIDVPDVPGFQAAGNVGPSRRVRVPQGRGCLLVVRPAH
ncbi:glycoside hydrolase domain-containing protein [Streptomyces sp. NPDC059349]|uniref:glycoside hydrolase domain-containing protein n=1 Tax=Streptomyces sp. NPDC059349 TaxID=3346808 RepID=UPI0036B40844